MPIVREFKSPRECVEAISPVEVDHCAAHPGLHPSANDMGKRLDGNADPELPATDFR
jgi:hypothetical protein